MKVPLLDLKPQYQSLKSEIDAAVAKVMESQYFILGPEVQAFEEEIADYLGAKKALGVSSGTDALLLALMALDVGPGDEVIVPTYSFFATAGVVSRLSAMPVFADVDPVTFNLDPKDFERKITPKTKAVVPVHLYGQSAAMTEIGEIAKKNGVKIVEDGAQAIGVEYKNGARVGNFGDVGCFSFFPSKNLGGFGDGGLVTTNDEDLYERLRIMRVHGGKPKYYHKIVGGNFRLDALQAAVLRIKLTRLDEWSQGRRDNAALYNKLFADRGLAEAPGKTAYDENNRVLLPKAVYDPAVDPESKATKNYHIYNQYVIRVGEKRDELRDFLKEKEIATEIYYPVPFHKQECFADIVDPSASYPVSDDAAATSIALPIYPELTDEQIAFVVDSIAEFFKG
jgi:dTDP-4-amino-4,6-dideoxygalactose transaminase